MESLNAQLLALKLRCTLRADAVEELEVTGKSCDKRQKERTRDRAQGRNDAPKRVDGEGSLGGDGWGWRSAQGHARGSSSRPIAGLVRRRCDDVEANV